MSRFLNSKYEALSPYTPGEQPRDKRYIKLNTNESPFPPGAKVLAAISETAVTDLRLYEDPTNTALKQALADFYGEFGLSAENFCPTAGSDEALELAFMAYGERGMQYPDLTYGFYSVFTALHHLESRVSPVTEDFRIDLSDYQGNDRSIVLANPNAPTGLLLTLAEIRQLLEANPEQVVIIDEAYIDFGGESALSLIPDYPNLLICQTFSKSRSLAGARIGFAAGNAALMEDLERIRNSRNPYNVSRLSQLAGIAALREGEYYRKNCEKIMESRTWLTKELRSLGFQLNDSFANFVFAKSPELSGSELYQRLRDRGILVRHFAAERIRDYNRITIGTQAEMEALVQALEEILKRMPQYKGR